MKNSLLLIMICWFSTLAVCQDDKNQSKEQEKPVMIEEPGLHNQDIDQKKTADLEKSANRKKAQKNLGMEGQVIQQSTEILNTSRNFVGIVPELSGLNGVKVLKVIQDSPAHAAGIKQGDLIRELDGKIVRSVNIIAKILDSKDAGQIIEWTIRRGEVESIVPIPLILNEDFDEATKLKKVIKHPKPIIKAEPISLILNAGFSVQKNQDAYQIVGLNREGKADKAGLIVGDIITHIDGKTADSKEKFVDVLNNALEDSEYVLKIEREGKEVGVKLKF